LQYIVLKNLDFVGDGVTIPVSDFDGGIEIWFSSLSVDVLAVVMHYLG
jgi:hypothetical protein